MTASEFAFLAMGLILGVAAGAALIEFVRARPPRPREVRVIVAPDAVPRRRAATLANDAFTESPVAVDPAAGQEPRPRRHFAWRHLRTPRALRRRPARVGRRPSRASRSRVASIRC